MKKRFTFYIYSLMLGGIILGLIIGGYASGVYAQSVSELFTRANQLLKSAKLQEAAGLYLQILEEIPEEVDAMVLLGSIYSRMGEFEKAEEMLTRVIILTPEYKDAYQILSNVYINQDRIPDAIAVLKQLLERDSQQREAMVKIVILYHQLGDYSNARSMLKILRDSGMSHNLPPNIERDLYAWRCDLNYIYEDIDLLPDGNETTLSLSYCLRKGFTMVGSFQRVNRFEQIDYLSSISAYFSLPEEINWYVNLGYGFNHNFLPDLRLDIQAQTEIIQGTSLILKTNFLSFPDKQSDIYSLGIEHYFSEKFSTLYQYSIGKSEGNFNSFSQQLKANWFEDNLTSTLGIAWGREISSEAGSETQSIVENKSCFGSITYWFKNNLGIKLNLSYDSRENSYNKKGIGYGLVCRF
ncbi:YaiO family outer membrane beta-barrel protein [Candidatus Atribacteria bacterium MT.SAG.1]|nr:YaiO family outer membrane beta-barrel protein [Candidatus Atribacteria bacterium MT.SAG.1]